MFTGIGHFQTSDASGRNMAVELDIHHPLTKYHAKIDMLLIESALIKYVEHFKIKIIPFKSNYANDIYIRIIIV
jgi:hypothetical protein